MVIDPGKPRVIKALSIEFRREFDGWYDWHMPFGFSSPFLGRRRWIAEPLLKDDFKFYIGEPVIVEYCGERFEGTIINKGGDIHLPKFKEPKEKTMSKTEVCKCNAVEDTQKQKVEVKSRQKGQLMDLEVGEVFVTSLGSSISHVVVMNDSRGDTGSVRAAPLGGGKDVAWPPDSCVMRARKITVEV